MVEITMSYEGDLSVVATHGPSAAALRTDAPKDNNGLGRSFSPTDLLATALGTCMLTVMGIVAKRHGLAMEGARVRVEKHMQQEPVRRVGRLKVEIAMPGGFEPAARTLLERAALACPVKQSLHADVVVDLSWDWSGAGVR